MQEWLALPQPSLSRSAGLQQVLVEGGVEVGLVTDDNVEESFVGGWGRLEPQQILVGDYSGLGRLLVGPWGMNKWTNENEQTIGRWTNWVDRLGRPLVRSLRMNEWTNENEQTIGRWTNWARGWVDLWSGPGEWVNEQIRMNKQSADGQTHNISNDNRLGQ